MKVGENMRELGLKLHSFFNRSLRYFVFSTMVTFGVGFIIILANLFAGVVVSLSFYMLVFLVFDLTLTFLICFYNSHKLFIPINRKLIKKLNEEEVERAREFNRRKRTNHRAS